jgi:hypothetical protein
MTHRRGLSTRQASGAGRATACLGCAIFLLLVPGLIPAQEAPSPPPESPYVGAEVCKTCHPVVYESWTKSKHASSYNHLADADAAKAECVCCHATGLPANLQAPVGKPNLPGTQCEACHGPGRTHAAEAVTGTLPARGKGVNARPDTSVCERCHNKQSPRFQGFVYGPMAKLVHVHSATAP